MQGYSRGGGRTLPSRAGLVEDGLSVLDFVRHGLHHYLAVGWPVMLGLGLGLPLVSFCVGLIVLLGLPVDYFVRISEHRGFRQAPRVARVILVVAKNLLGAMVFIAGFVMALPLVPGPGILCMLVGLGLIDFPGKRSLVRRLLREKHVLSSVNKMRARFGKPPILTNDDRSRSMVDRRA